MWPFDRRISYACTRIHIYTESSEVFATHLPPILHNSIERYVRTRCIRKWARMIMVNSSNIIQFFFVLIVDQPTAISGRCYPYESPQTSGASCWKSRLGAKSQNNINWLDIHLNTWPHLTLSNCYAWYWLRWFRGLTVHFHQKHLY